MAEIYRLNKIKSVIKEINTVDIIERGFIYYSQGKVVVPPVGEMIFDDPPGDVHIKYGYIRGDDYYVVKIASGFYENKKLGIPSSNGLMLIFNQKTGQLVAILLDEGYLTDVRTGAAGAVVAKHLAPKNVERIGIFGAGVQGRMQLMHLKSVIGCRDVVVWGIDRDELERYKDDMKKEGFSIETTLNGEDVTSTCNLIVTATPSRKPLIYAHQIKRGTHITAVGADTPEKNELDPEILKKADIVVADSITQCIARGEIHQAVKAGTIEKEKIFELGRIIIDERLGRSSEDQITVADLTGVAVQDIQISKAVVEKLVSSK